MKLLTMKGFIIGLVLALHICIGLLAYDFFGDLEVKEWASNVVVIERELTWSIFTAPILFSLYVYIAGSVLILDHALLYKQKASIWAVASLIFTPVLTGIVYYLTSLRYSTRGN